MFRCAWLAVINASRSILFAYALQRGLASRQWVVHTRDVLDASTRLLTALLDAETSLRGFIITRDTSILEPYPGRAGSRRQRARAGFAFSRRTIRLSSARRLRSPNARARDSSSSTRCIDVARQPGYVCRPVRRARSRDDARHPRSWSNASKRDEERLLVVREREAERAERVASAVIVLGAIVAGLLALLVNRNLDRALDDRRQAIDEVESANERLQEQAVELEAQADAAQTAAIEAEQATEHAQVSLLAAEESERRAERLQVATEAFGGALSLDEVGEPHHRPGDGSARRAVGRARAARRQRHASLRRRAQRVGSLRRRTCWT